MNEKMTFLMKKFKSDFFMQKKKKKGEKKKNDAFDKKTQI